MFASVKSHLDRKRYGIFYTPPKLAQTLVEWAIRSANDTVLEPSFGGCNFLKASHERLLGFGCRDPLRQICGTDVDKHALDSLGQAFGMVDVQRRFLLRDFLTAQPTDFCIQQFDAIVGNPPYVSHHAISPEQKLSAWKRAGDSGWQLRKTASLWAYFVLHSLTFCKIGGRIAFVLPQAFLLANYASAVRSILHASFESVEFKDVRDRQFRDQGTDERSVLLLATGFRGATQPVAKRIPGVDGITRPSRSHRAKSALNGDAAEIFETIASRSISLGECADLRIGTVTGANKLFVITAATAEENALSDAVLIPALARVPRIRGLEYTGEDHVRAVTAGERCYLVRPPAKSLDRQTTSIRRYFSSVSQDVLANNRTFNKRSFWFSVDDIKEPDAFLSYMHHEAPTLLANTVRAVCMNNIHRLWWKADVSLRQQKLVAISIVSTFTQLSAELEGRTYGGGVLKHELGEARKIRLLVPESLTDSQVNSAHVEIDEHLRHGERDLATARADEVLLHAVARPRDATRAASLLSTALHTVRNRRTAR